MATRGIYGFRKNNRDKLSYNHFNSFPDVLGADIYYQGKTSNYYPCKLIKEYKLEDIKTDKFSLQEFKKIDE